MFMTLFNVYDTLGKSLPDNPLVGAKIFVGAKKMTFLLD